MAISLGSASSRLSISQAPSDTGRLAHSRHHLVIFVCVVVLRLTTFIAVAIVLLQLLFDLLRLRNYLLAGWTFDVVRVDPRDDALAMVQVTAGQFSHLLFLGLFKSILANDAGVVDIKILFLCVTQAEVVDGKLEAVAQAIELTLFCLHLKNEMLKRDECHGQNTQED